MNRKQKVEQIAQDVRSVLIAKQGGTSLKEFLDLYQEFIGCNFPYQAHGFSTPIQFLSTMPTYVSITSQNDSFHLKAVIDKKVEHIDKLVQKQKPPNIKSSQKLPSFLPRSLSNRPTVKPMLPGEIRQKLNRMVAFYGEGISFPNLLIAFKKLYKEELDFQLYGFHSLEECVANESQLKIKEVYGVSKIFHSGNKNSHHYTEMHKNKTVVDDVSKRNGTKFENIEEEFHNRMRKFDGSGVSKSAQRKLKTVVDKYPEGIFAFDFPSRYKKMNGEAFELSKFGYISLSELVAALPHIFTHVNVPGSEKGILLLPPGGAHKAAENRVRKEIIISNIRQLLQAYDNVKLEEFHRTYYNHFHETLLTGQEDSDNIDFFQLLYEEVPLKIMKQEDRIYVCLRKNEISTNGTSEKSSSCEPVPGNTAPPGFRFKIQSIPAGYRESDFVPVCISSVVNLMHFWIQILHPSTDGFLEMQKEMNLFYSRPESDQYIIKEYHIKVETPCVVWCPHKQQWLRAEIKSIASLEDVCVYYVDFGGSGRVPTSMLRYIRCEYIELPAQALKARLDYIELTERASLWKQGLPESTEFVCPKLDELLLAVINGVKDSTYYICLYDEDGFINLNNELIWRSYAKYSEDNCIKETCQYKEQDHNSASCSKTLNKKNDIIT